MPAADQPPTILWPASAPASTIGPTEVHLWAWSLFDQPPITPVWIDSLAPDERSRAAKFVFPEHRRRFLLAHGGMRQLLAKYLNCPPASLSYASGEFQKPFLAFEDLRFNLSHSNNLALLAVTRCSDIGVDVECCTAHPSALPIDQLSAPEQAFLRALPAEQVRDAFFTIWTRKEALLKALGLGLHGDLSSFSALPGIGHAALHAANDRLTTLPHFESHNLIPARDYQAAVSVLNPNTTLRLFAHIF